VLAGAHLEDVRAKIADLRAMERVLRDTVARCTDGRRANCALIEALYREAPNQAVQLPDSPDLRRKKGSAVPLGREAGTRRRDLRLLAAVRGRNH